MKKLFIDNLPESADEKKIRDLFAKVGTVKSVSVPEEVSGDRHYGFVEMDDDEADRAVDQLGGAEIDGQAITVTPAMTGREE